MLHATLLVALLGTCEPTIEVGLEVGSVEAPNTNVDIELPIRAFHLFDVDDVHWFVGLRYDPEVLQIVAARPTSPLGGIDFLYLFADFPAEGRATLDYSRVPTQPDPVTPDADGKGTLSILTVRVLKPVDRVELELTETAHRVTGEGEFSARLYHCEQWVYSVPERALDPVLRLRNGTIYVVGDSQPFIRGDADANGAVNLSDAIAILQQLFVGGGEVRCIDAADVNDSGDLSITDAVALVRHLFQGQSAPSAPYPAPGPDPTADGKGCAVAPAL